MNYSKAKVYTLYCVLKTLITGRGHKCKFDRVILNSAEEFINKYSEDIKKKKIISHPYHFPKSDKSCNISLCG